MESKKEEAEEKKPEKKHGNEEGGEDDDDDENEGEEEREGLGSVASSGSSRGHLSLPQFRPFTINSLKRIAKRIEKEAEAKKAAAAAKEGAGDDRQQTIASSPDAVAAATIAADAFAATQQQQQQQRDGSAAPGGLPSSAQADPYALYGGKIGGAGGAGGAGAAPTEEEEKPVPDAQFEVGQHLPQKYGDFPPSLYGRPIEDLDVFYRNRYTFMIVGRDKNLFRFSATKAFFILSPFHPIRRAALFILTHPVFSLAVMVVILVNCVFMATKSEIKEAEWTFTIIYTVEGVVKMLARGFILADFTYLRDAWNWLDFIVVAFAYITQVVNLGNVSVLRTFRVLRALKTVAVVPGLKTIVGALMEAVRRLRDVMILSVFVLSIFALIGLQLYQGSLRRRCIKNGDNVTDAGPYSNASKQAKMAYNDKQDNWDTGDGKLFRLCGESDEAGTCPTNFTCNLTSFNPDFNFTNFDNFGWAMLCAFRLMTQDAWENLHQQVIRANGKVHIFFFIIVIFLGSFYLVNVILAIVAMAYEDSRKQDDQEAADDRAAELALLTGEDGEDGGDDGVQPGEASDDDTSRKKRPSNTSFSGAFLVPRDDVVSMRSEWSPSSTAAAAHRSYRHGSVPLCVAGAPPYHRQVSVSLPGSPYPGERRMTRHRSSQFSWKRPLSRTTTATSEGQHQQQQQQQQQRQPREQWSVVEPCLENLHLPLEKLPFPYADDSAAVTPDDLCIYNNTPFPNRPRLSSGGSRMTRLPSQFRGSRQEAFLVSRHPNQLQPHHHQQQQHRPSAAADALYANHRSPPKATEPTHFQWNASTRKRKKQNGHRPEIDEKPRELQLDAVLCGDDVSGDGKESVGWAGCKGNNVFSDNPFIYRTPSNQSVALEDVLKLKDLTNQLEKGQKKGLFGYVEGTSKKEFLKEKCMLLLFGWECTPGWYKFAHIIELFIMDAFVDLFITLCIVVNTVFMAMEHYDMNSTMETMLNYGNLVFTTIFTVEAGLKVLALGLYKYLQDKWSCFDFIIVILSLVELGLSNVKGLSILRSFRLLRVFKLAKSWPTLNLLISIIGRTMGALGNLCFVLAIIIFIFAVMGMQVFGDSYEDSKFPGEDLRWHFRDFLHSFMIVFRILCGEWIENMWGCIRAYNVAMACIPFFLLTMIIGNLVVLNLFLALLLSSFGAESLKQSQEEEGPNKLQEAIDRIKRFVLYIKSHVTYCFKVKIRRQPTPIDFYYDEEPAQFVGTTTMQENQMDGDMTIIVPQMGNGGIRDSEAKTKQLQQLQQQQTVGVMSKGDFENVHVTAGAAEHDYDGAMSLQSEPSTVKVNTGSQSSICSRASGRSSDDRSHVSDTRCWSSVTKDSYGSARSLSSSLANDFYFHFDGASNGEKDSDAGRDANDAVKVFFVKLPDECCPRCVSKLPLWSLVEDTVVGRAWWKMRCYAYALVEHPYFETFIIIMILASSLALAAEDREIDTKPTLLYALKLLDKVFTVIFVFEMAVKIAAYGLKKYFTDAWCWLDFIIVTISLIGWSAENSGQSGMGAFRALRTLRALRPLRAVSRWEGMKVVVNALIQAIPAILNVLLVCLVFWLIFSIMGVNLFMGRFGRCRYTNDSSVVPLNNTLGIANKSSCITARDANLSVEWFHPKINFDHVLGGYLALFQVATFKGWMDIMYAAIDSSEMINGQPSRESKSLMYIYFVLFIVFGSFFTLNLFIGVIIENFNMQKKKAGGSLEMLMTEDQKKYYNAMKKLGSKQPTKPIPKPKFAFQLFFFKLTKNQKFDVAIMVVILLNMFTMTIEHFDQSDDFTAAMKFVNGVFIVVFTLECVMKLLGLRLYYFKEPWNVFDFIVVVVSILTLALSDLLEGKLPISPTLLRVVRVFRVGRVLRLVKSAKGIRTLLFSLAVSMPALFNIGLLLFLVMFIYSIVGVSCFMHVLHSFGIDDMFNFEKFVNAMIVLFQTCTSAGWSDILAGLMNEPEGCSDVPPTVDQGACGNSPLGIMYLVSYLVISFLVIVNMYIAVILENFSQATEDVQQGLTQDDFDMYYELWEKYDEKATQYIPLSQLSEFVDTLEEPLKLEAPNLFMLVAMDIPICEGDRVHCVDILDALTKHYLGTANDEAGELGDLKGPEKLDYHPISSTLRRQREVYVTKVIQRTWRNFVRRRQEQRAAAAAAAECSDGTAHALSDVATTNENKNAEEAKEEEEEGQEIDANDRTIP